MKRTDKIRDGYICPPTDNPLGLFLRIGWRILSRRIYPDKAMRTPMFFYLVGRRGAGLFSIVANLAFWTMVMLPEFLLMLGFVPLINQWLALIVLECLLLPVLIGFWTQFNIQYLFRRYASIIVMDEIAMTRISPADIMFSFVIIPVSLQALGAVASLLFSIVIIWKVSAEFGFLANLNILFPILSSIALICRFFITKTSIEFSSIFAMRAQMFYTGRFYPLIRALRDWVFPFCTMLALAMVASAAVLLMFIGSGGIFFWVLIPLLLLIIFGVPAAYSELAADLLYWIPRMHHEWWINAGNESTYAPTSLWREWPAKVIGKELMDRYKSGL